MNLTSEQRSRLVGLLFAVMLTIGYLVIGFALVMAFQD